MSQAVVMSGLRHQDSSQANGRHDLIPRTNRYNVNLPKQDAIPAPGEHETPKRFNDTERSIRIYRLSGLIVECWHGKPRVGILPDDTRLEQTADESHKDFLARCESRIATEPAI